MAKKLPAHIENLRSYLFQESERNEDLALSYFRKSFGEKFVRQSDAENSDGYVPGHFIIEIKGDNSDWYSGLMQGLAYETKGLSFSLVIVVAKHFLAVWQKDDIPADIRSDLLKEKGAPSAIGKKFARKYAANKKSILKKACWHRPELFDSLFATDLNGFHEAIKNFDKTVSSKKRHRQPVSLKNFTNKLEEMKQFFDQENPIRAVRAFYSMIYGPWDEISTVQISARHDDRATIGGTEICYLIPAKRNKFKEFVENHCISLKNNENIDDFFSRYDEALDVVDQDFRIKNGIYFTDLDLSKFVMWSVKQSIPQLGKEYLVIDPACGSGNLVTNWKSPLELRHKVVSEIEPELLYAIEQRMKGDQWHDGKFTVVPKVSENIGLNFLKHSADEYLSILNKYLKDKGQKPDKPIAFLCNPPYRNDDDQTTDSVDYEVHPSIINVTGPDGGAERYCSFLAQMKLICEKAENSGLPSESILLLFTKAAWLTDRPVFQTIRRAMFSTFDPVGGILVNGKEFFDLSGKFPIAFTMWRYKGSNANLNPDRPIHLKDLTWVKKNDLKTIDWNNSMEVNEKCTKIFKEKKSINVSMGIPVVPLKNWVSATRLEFQREKRKNEKKDRNFVCGLPSGDRRHERKKTLGEKDGTFIGFMDDLTPCRIAKNPCVNAPWFRLNSPFMDFKKNRCFSGPVDQKGFSSLEPEAFFRMTFWYSLGRCFTTNEYPMWVDALEMWAPSINPKNVQLIKNLVFAILYAENECVETLFPANNPVREAIQISISNPLSSNNSKSFWSTVILPQIGKTLKGTKSVNLIQHVDTLYSLWSKILGKNNDIVAPFEAPYFVGTGRLTKNAGLVQIKDYANETENELLLAQIQKITTTLKEVKLEFYDLLISKDGLNYFSQKVQPNRKAQPFKPKTKFDHIVEKRLAIASLLVNDLKNDPNFGRTKLTKLFYLIDSSSDVDLQTDYAREAAGPLDQRALYNQNIGIEAVALRHGYFKAEHAGKIFRYSAESNLPRIVQDSKRILSSKTLRIIKEIVSKFEKLNTDQCEIVATLYACWNDLLLDNKKTSNELILKEFFDNWHEKKKRFDRKKVARALDWMNKEGIVPTGTGKKTSSKV